MDNHKINFNTCKECGFKWRFKKRFDCSTNNSRNCPNCFSYCWDFGLNVSCYCCQKIVLVPLVHHRDGDHFNNSKENRTPLCFICHGAIHKNISPPNFSRKTSLRRITKANKEKGAIKRIMELRGEIL